MAESEGNPSIVGNPLAVQAQDAVAELIHHGLAASKEEAARKAIKTIKDPGRKLPKAESPLIYAAEQGAVCK